MTMLEFRNRLCILRSLDRDELVDAGVILPAESAMWASFQSDPVRALLAAEDWRLERLWTVIEARCSRAIPRKAAPPLEFPSLLDNPEAYGMRLETGFDRDADQQADRRTNAASHEWSES